MNNYPADVTGWELATAGPDTESEAKGQCPNGHSILRRTYRGASWLACGSCHWSEEDSR
jgi:hypothetical protein